MVLHLIGILNLLLEHQIGHKFGIVILLDLKILVMMYLVCFQLVYTIAHVPVDQQLFIDCFLEVHVTHFSGAYRGATTALSGIRIATSNSATFDSGDVTLYGVL